MFFCGQSRSCLIGTTLLRLSWPPLRMHRMVVHAPQAFARFRIEEVPVQAMAEAGHSDVIVESASTTLSDDMAREVSLAGD